MKPVWPKITPAMLGAARTACAVSAIAMLPVLSWQALDARGSNAQAAIASVIAQGLPETILIKTGLTWSHKKSDRLNVEQATITAIIDVDDVDGVDDDEVLVPVVEASLDSSDIPAVDNRKQQEGFSDWLVSNDTDQSSARIVDFASRKSNVNRSTCRADHDTLVSAFNLSKVRVLSDQPALFQSSICADNGEIVITCFGTTSTISPRKARPSSHCAKRS